MADHQPLPVHGYKTQSEETVALANEGKILEERVLRWIEKIGNMPGEPPPDGRFMALGKTNIQQGFMWAVRAIFQPGRISLPDFGEELETLIETSAERNHDRRRMINILEEATEALKKTRDELGEED